MAHRYLALCLYFAFVLVVIQQLCVLANNRRDLHKRGSERRQTTLLAMDDVGVDVGVDVAKEKGVERCRTMIDIDDAAVNRRRVKVHIHTATVYIYSVLCSGFFAVLWVFFFNLLVIYVFVGFFHGRRVC